LFMGFGGMLAGGCAVGAGVSGASVFTLTAFVTLGAMWAAAMATDWALDRPHEAGRMGAGVVPASTDPELSASYARP
jgi:uncharacterized protein